MFGPCLAAGRQHLHLVFGGEDADGLGVKPLNQRLRPLLQGRHLLGAGKAGHHEIAWGAANTGHMSVAASTQQAARMFGARTACTHTRARSQHLWRVVAGTWLLVQDVVVSTTMMSTGAKWSGTADDWGPKTVCAVWQQPLLGSWGGGFSGAQQKDYLSL